MKIASITAGAAGMFCGSCMHDNALAGGALALGHDALLIPTYTPIRTDEEDVSQKRVFFGGINVYLQQKTGLFRHTPLVVRSALERPWLLNWVSKFAMGVQAEFLGDLTRLDARRASHGRQRKEVETLVSLAGKRDGGPMSSCSPMSCSRASCRRLKRRLKVPVVAHVARRRHFPRIVAAESTANGRSN